MKNLFSGVYNNKRVMVTGHTGFKGSWLIYWLKEMGAQVYGYSLAPNINPNHYTLLHLGVEETIGDIRITDDLIKSFTEFQPQIVFHLAAQPLVREAYNNPSETYSTNVMGTVNVLDAIRITPSVESAVFITTDKCYDNKEWSWGYREIDTLGGYDPYSASKACCELVISSYQKSFFQDSDVLIASCRAGNVIGGGDWAKDRIIPDIVRARFLSKNLRIRAPQSIRPWQHVLESLSGYLLLGQKLLTGESEYTGAWNFGPIVTENISVKDICEIAQDEFGTFPIEYDDKNVMHETKVLRLNCDKAYHMLNWKPVWDNARETIKKTFEWYNAYYMNDKIISENQLSEYVKCAKSKMVCWAT